jgi:hypothetical protein
MKRIAIASKIPGVHAHFAPENRFKIHGYLDVPAEADATVQGAVFTATGVYLPHGVEIFVERIARKGEPAPDKENLIEVWSEGFRVMSEQGGVTYHGKFNAACLKDACDMLAAQDPVFKRNYDPLALTHYGCKLFDNEAAARASFP